jgi:riboflavin-specific deaminase-like protein
MTLDGYVGGANRTPMRISNDLDILRVHELRAASDAVLVGVGTVIADDPKLTVKWELLGRAGPQPLRVVMDPDLRTPEGALVRDARAPTLFLARTGVPARPGWSVEHVPAPNGSLDVGAALDRLGARRVKRLLVEGGPRTLRRFFEGGHVDEFTLFVAPLVLAEPTAARLFESPMDLSAGMRLASAEMLRTGLVLTWRRR